MILDSTTAVAEIGGLWEIAKGVLLTIGAAGALGVFRMRDDVREIKHELFGRDGSNGMRSLVKRSADRLDRIEARNIALDAVAEAERDQYEGEEKRHNNRRLADIIKEKLG